MKIGILSQWYDPEPGPASLPGVLARELVLRGHEVKVLTGFPNYPTGRLVPGYRLKLRMEETLAGVQVTRTFLFPNHSISGLGRILNYASFGLSAALFGGKAFKDIDVLWVNYSPITVALPMFIQRGRKIPIISEVADLWPDTLLVSGLAGAGALTAMAGPFLTAWTNAMYRASKFVVHIAPSVRGVLSERGVPETKIRFVPKPADEDFFHAEGKSQREQLGLNEQDIVLLYAGSMGTAQSLESLIRAVLSVCNPNFKLLMVGSGTEEARLRNLASTDNRIMFLGRRPMEEMASLLATSDVAFIGLADHPLSRLTMPSKTQAIFASGRAVLVAASGDVANIVTDADAGFVAQAGSAESIASSIDEIIALGRHKLQEKGRNARRAYEVCFSVKATTDAIENLLRKAAGASSKDAQQLRAEDIPKVAELHRLAFPDFFLSKLGSSFLRLFYRGFLTDPTSVTVVERDSDGVPIAVAVGSTEPRGFFRRLLKRHWAGFAIASAGYVVRNPGSFCRLLRALVYRGDTPMKTDAALLSSICVDPNHQGDGWGKKVLESWTEKAANEGAELAYLTTDALNNESVRTFYEKQGWTPDMTYMTPEGRSMMRYVIGLGEPGARQKIETGN